MLNLANPHNLQFAIAVGLVVAYSWSRYNTPVTARSETTWSKFMLGRLAYVAIIFGAFTILLASPEVGHALIDNLQVEGAGKVLDQLSFPLIIALFLTVFLSEVPICSRLDRLLRSYFHRIAAIPKERRVRIAMLQRSKLAVSEAVRAEAVKWFKAQDLREEDLVLEPTEVSPGSLWSRLTVHAVCLDHLSRSPRYAAQLIESGQYEEFRSAYEHLAGKAKHAFPLLRSDSGQKAVRLLRQEFVEQAEGLLSQLYDFTSRLILKCERTERQREACMASLGLAPERRERVLPVHEFLWLFVLLTIFLAGSIGSLGGELRLTKVLAIVLAQVAAVAIALVVHPEGPAPAGMTVPPIGRYLLSGGLAFSAWAALMGTLAVVESGELGHFLETGRSGALAGLFGPGGRWPWSLLVVTLAVSLSALTDDWIDLRIRRFRSRFDLAGWANGLDGLVGATGMAGVTYFLIAPRLADLQADAWQIALVTAGIGLLLGLLVPSAYRRRSSASQESKEELPASSPPPSLALPVASGGR